MNAIWLTRIAAYKNTDNCLGSGQVLLNLKNERRELLLKKYGILLPKIRLHSLRSTQQIMLAEARAAHIFWQKFSRIMPVWTYFRSRKPGSNDIGNHLLDVGYHHITNKVKNILAKYDISSALGILHVARTANSAPLAYDLVEMFRAETVEAEVLRFFRMKKRPIEKLSKKDIPIFLSRINRRMNHRYFIKSFKQCHTYQYYMELQILKFIKAVNHTSIFEPIHLPSRHDTRCS